MTKKFDDDINIFKKSKSRKNKRDRINLQGKPMKPKTKPRERDYHLKAKLERKNESKIHFEKKFWE